MNELDVDYLTSGVDLIAEETKLKLNLAPGVDAVIAKVKQIIETCKKLDAIGHRMEVRFDECLYEVSEEDSKGWRPNLYRLIYSPSGCDSCFVYHYVEGKHSSENHLETESVDLNELLVYLEGLQKQAA